MRTRIVPLAILLVAVSRPAAAEQATPVVSPPPVAAQEQPGGAPPAEVALGATQLLLGALLTFGAGFAMVLVAADARSAPLGLVAAGGTPGLGAWAVCGLGRTSPWYEGGCAPTIVGGYVGALALAIPMAYIGAAAFAPHISDGGFDRELGAAFGAALGVVAGTTVGATIGWHVSKRRRAASTTTPLRAPPPPPPPLLEGGAIPRARSVGRQGVAIILPLLSLRF